MNEVKMAHLQLRVSQHKTIHQLVKHFGEELADQINGDKKDIDTDTFPFIVTLFDSLNHVEDNLTSLMKLEGITINENGEYVMPVDNVEPND